MMTWPLSLIPRGTKLLPRKPALGPSCGYPLGMPVELSIVYEAPASPISIPELKRWSLGGRSHTLTTPIVYRLAVCLVTPPHLPLTASSPMSSGDLTMVPSSILWLAAVHQETLVPGESVQEVQMPQEQGVSVVQAQDGSGATPLQDELALVELEVDDASLGAISVKVDGAGPWQGDDAGGPLHNLVVCGADLGMPRRTILGDAIPAPDTQVPRDWGQSDCSYGVPSALYLRLLTGVGGGQDRVHVFRGHHHGRVATRDAGLGRLEYPASDLG
jgi:hypothetical protein